jgi:hypothetical protein
MQVSKQTSNDWRFARVNQMDFDGAEAVTLDDVVRKAAIGII